LRCSKTKGTHNYRQYRRVKLSHKFKFLKVSKNAFQFSKVLCYHHHCRAFF
jgi:hypothetical protein